MKLRSSVHRWLKLIAVEKSDTLQGVIEKLCEREVGKKPAKERRV